MKLKTIALALATMGAATGVSAQVLGAGASATGDVIRNTLLERVCASGTATVFTDVAAGVTQIVRRITCTGDAAVAGVAGQALDVGYNGASSYAAFSGTSGVLGQPSVNSASGTCTAAVAGPALPGVTRPYNIRYSCGLTGAGPVAFGNADTELRLFQVNNATPTLNAAQIANFTVDNGFAVIFGVAVTNELYRALQTDQSLDTTQPILRPNPEAPDSAPLTGAALAANVAWEASVPNISRSNIQSWATQLSSLSAVPDALFANPANGAAFPAAPIWVRRSTSSGTTMSFNSQIMGYGCSPQASLPAVSGFTISGTTPVLSAASNVNQGGTGELNMAAISAYTGFAGGYISTEEPPTAGAQFVKIDGYYPSKANARNGRYNWVTQQVLTRRSAGTIAAAIGTTPVATFNAIYTELLNDVRNIGFTQPAALKIPGVYTTGGLDNSWRYARDLGNNCSAANRQE